MPLQKLRGGGSETHFRIILMTARNVVDLEKETAQKPNLWDLSNIPKVDEQYFGG
jgi:hypothetical protein